MADFLLNGFGIKKTGAPAVMYAVYASKNSVHIFLLI